MCCHFFVIRRVLLSGVVPELNHEGIEMIAATDNLTMPFHYYDMISGEREYDGGFNWEKFLTTV